MLTVITDSRASVGQTRYFVFPLLKVLYNDTVKPLHIHREPGEHTLAAIRLTAKNLIFGRQLAFHMWTVNLKNHIQEET